MVLQNFQTFCCILAGNKHEASKNINGESFSQMFAKNNFWVFPFFLSEGVEGVRKIAPQDFDFFAIMQHANSQRFKIKHVHENEVYKKVPFVIILKLGTYHRYVSQ